MIYRVNQSTGFTPNSSSKSMVAAPLILGGGLIISDQNNWEGGGDLSKKINLGGAKFKGGPKILGEAYEQRW